MKTHTFIPENVCPTKIQFELENGILIKVMFEGGCNGNLQALANLVQGMRVDEVLGKLKGIDCEGRGTSCADQLSKALAEAISSKA